MFGNTHPYFTHLDTCGYVCLLHVWQLYCKQLCPANRKRKSHKCFSFIPSVPSWCFMCLLKWWCLILWLVCRVLQKIAYSAYIKYSKIMVWLGYSVLPWGTKRSKVHFTDTHINSYCTVRHLASLWDFSTQHFEYKVRSSLCFKISRAVGAMYWLRLIRIFGAWLNICVFLPTVRGRFHFLTGNCLSVSYCESQ